MIKKLNNKEEKIALQIYNLFQASYQIEAELLQVAAFPPLKRTLNDFVNSQTEFYGFAKAGKIAGIVEIELNDNNIDIHSLVVHPTCFRQGIGSKLIAFVLKKFDVETYTVQTAIKNEPATKLYRKSGFKKQEQFDTEIGIRIMRFIKRKTV